MPVPTGDRSILFDKGELFFQRGDRAKLRMIPIAENLFLIETLDYVRLRFVKNVNGLYFLESLYDDGRVVPHSKNISPESK